jgi:acetyl-CoA carboxylase carboxyltransferase component
VTDQVKDIVKESVDDLINRKNRALLNGGIEKIQRQHEAGYYTARERIDLLVDSDSFMEFGMLNHSDIPGLENKSAGDGLIVGIAKVDGRPIVVQAGDKTVFAGTEGEKVLFTCEKRKPSMSMQ